MVVVDFFYENHDVCHSLLIQLKSFFTKLTSKLFSYLSSHLRKALRKSLLLPFLVLSCNTFPRASASPFSTWSHYLNCPTMLLGSFWSRYSCCHPILTPFWANLQFVKILKESFILSCHEPKHRILQILQSVSMTSKLCPVMFLINFFSFKTWEQLVTSGGWECSCSNNCHWLVTPWCQKERYIWCDIICLAHNFYVRVIIPTMVLWMSFFWCYPVTILFCCSCHCIKHQGTAVCISQSFIFLFLF